MYTKVPDGYYDTDAWKKKRWAVLARKNFTCQACGKNWGPSRQYMLEVHHTPRAYQELGHERLEDLFPLCGKRAPHRCHKKGKYTSREIRRDRKSQAWVNALLWVIAVPFRLVRWTWRKWHASPSEGKSVGRAP